MAAALAGAPLQHRASSAAAIDPVGIGLASAFSAPALSSKRPLSTVPLFSASQSLVRNVRQARDQAFDASFSSSLSSIQGRWQSSSAPGPELVHIQHPRMCGILLPELSIDPVQEVASFIREEYEVQGSSVLDGDGVPVVWPWQRQRQLADRRPDDSLERLINLGLDEASADGRRGRNTTGVKAWFAFCADERVSPHRPLDPVSPLWMKLQEEWLAMRFCCALVEERGVVVTTASQYFSTTQGWHAREHGVKLAGGLKLERLPQMLKGLRRVFGTLPPKVRRGLAPQALRQAMDILLDPSNPTHANMRAALATAFQGLLRGEEFAIESGSVWRSADRLTRADLVEITFDRLVLMMHPCKNMKCLKGKSVPLVIGAGGGYIDAVAEMRNMLRVDPASGSNPAHVPLFRDPSTNACITKRDVHNLVQSLMAAIGENPAHFGTHSLRIGGATSLFAAGADPTVIRTMGRWSSDIYRLYVRACFERCCEWTKRAGSTHVTDVVVDFDEVDSY